MNTQEVATRLVELCRAGKYEQAQNELYADDAISIEPDGLPSGALGNAQGLAAIRAKGQRFNSQVEQVHDNRVGEPNIAGSWFSVPMGMDATLKDRGRIDMNELAVYHVRDGKIIQEQFFYDTN